MESPGHYDPRVLGLVGQGIATALTDIVYLDCNVGLSERGLLPPISFSFRVSQLAVCWMNTDLRQECSQCKKLKKVLKALCPVRASVWLAQISCVLNRTTN